MQQWVARKLLNDWATPDEQYNVGDVVQFPTPDGQGQYAGAVLQVTAMGTARPCCLTSTTRWPASR
jgi:FKBP-type peptidyl-prolyl cis-trans isomerase SlpA